MLRDNPLNTYETNTLLQFFLHYMDQEQRRRMMLEFPTIYQKLFPDVKLQVFLQGRELV